MAKYIYKCTNIPDKRGTSSPTVYFFIFIIFKKNLTAKFDQYKSERKIKILLHRYNLKLNNVTNFLFFK